MIGTDDVSLLLDWYAGVLPPAEADGVRTRLCREPALADLAFQLARDEVVVREWVARHAGLPQPVSPAPRGLRRVALVVGSLAAAVLAAVVLSRPEAAIRLEDDDTVASIEDWSGEAAIIGEDGESRVLTSGGSLRRGEWLQTGTDGQITFRFGDSARMELAADSRVFLPEGISAERDPRLTLESGDLSADVSPSRSIIVQTPHARLQAGQTRFHSSAIPENTWVATESGMVTMTPMGGGGPLELRTNQFGVAQKGDLPGTGSAPLVGVLTKPRTSFAYPSGPVPGLAVSPADSSPRVAMLASDGSIAVRSLPSRETAVLPPFLKSVRRVRFSPDGRTLAVVGDDRRVWLQSANDPDSRVALPKQKGDIRAFAFSPDGSRIAFSAGVVRNQPEYRLCDTLIGNEIASLGEANPSPITALDWQPNQPRLAEGRADGHLILREMLGYRVESVLIEVGSAIDLVRWSPDGQVLAVGFRNGRVGLYEVRSRTWLWQDDSHPGPITSLEFSPDGRLLLSTGSDAVVRLRDAIAGDSLHLLRGSNARSSGAAFSPDGREIWVAGYDRQVRVWDRPIGR